MKAGPSVAVPQWARPVPAGGRELGGGSHRRRAVFPLERRLHCGRGGAKGRNRTARGQNDIRIRGLTAARVGCGVSS